MYKYLVNTECEETPHYQCSAYRSTQCKGKQLVKIVSEGDTEFNVFYVNNGKRQRILGMDHPVADVSESISVHRQHVQHYAAAAHADTHVIGHDSTNDVYILFFFILVQGKTSWNVSAYVGVNVEMQNRTNNPIESYNRRVKQAVGSHPTLPDFVAKVKLEADVTSNYLTTLLTTAVLPPHADPVTVPIPEAYNTPSSF
ncbi:hypothetical protein GQ600_17784 [Phytophthora cactorum]|nr:hypothetical protein GQ600_17784 [Phytophthora cactorum]